MKKILTILLLGLPIIGFNQQGKNIDLKEVVNTSAVFPKIKILEAIEEKLTEKVKKSRYEKIFLGLVENRRKKDSTVNN